MDTDKNYANRNFARYCPTHHVCDSCGLVYGIGMIDAHDCRGLEFEIARLADDGGPHADVFSEAGMDAPPPVGYLVPDYYI